jgi:hypothetical protein
VWWDPRKTSVYNGQPGSYVSNGERYPLGQIPRHAVQVDLAP